MVCPDASSSPSRQLRFGIDVGVDAAHHVVHHWPYRDRLTRTVDVGVILRQLADER